MSSISRKEDTLLGIDLELYFLIVRFLSAGPCKDTAEILKQELQDRQLLPRRIDWEGREHFRSLDDLVKIYRHISPDHLQQICQRIGPLLDKEIPTNVTGMHSLLGAGRQSLLRTKDTATKTVWKSSKPVANFHGCPPFPPNSLLKPPHQLYILSGRETSGSVYMKHAVPQDTYSHVVMYSRTLGHLSAVYCVIFDRMGNFILTGADEHLIKVWSARDGRLFATLRGHSAEITDMAISHSNRLLASGSCDKLIRVWDLKTLAPVAVLHGHTGIVTSLQFCPLTKGGSRYLASTGGDGNVCYWQYDSTFNTKPIKFIERSRAGAQMLCSSFSAGGIFLATGSSDSVVRIFCFLGTRPEKICELEAHTDRVDSIQYSSRYNRFVSGSKDGTARIWRYERQEWKCILLNMSTTLSTSSKTNDGSKPHVTMVGWNKNDSLVITAVTDYSVKVWDSHTGQLVHVLTGHEDEIFVLEHNPNDSRLLLSAGHDGHIFIWNLDTGKPIKSFFNLIEGQGHGAVFDCKWSPDGQSFAATDSHGHILQFGLGSSDRYDRNPTEMFFHTDYRPLIRDANDYVLDEQTQQPPHLMPPPFLVDVDGNPHPTHYQRLVPGREKCPEHQLVPSVGVTPSGDREVLDEQVFLEPDQVDHHEDNNRLDVSIDGHRPSIDDMIERLAHARDDRAGHSSGQPGPLLSPRPSAADASMISGARRASTRGGEGIRQAAGENIPVSQRATQTDLNRLKKRVVVRPLDPVILRCDEQSRQSLADDEIKEFLIENKKKPLITAESESSDSGLPIKTRGRQKERDYRTRTVRRGEQTGRNRLTTRALYDTEEEEEAEETGNSSEGEPEMWSSGNESDSSVYSDWAANGDGGLSLQPPKRQSQRRPKKRKLSSSSEEEEDKDKDDVNVTTPLSVSSKETTHEEPRKRRPSPQKRKQKKLLNQAHTVQELPEEFRPPEWLTDTIPRRAPYVPQIGDEVIYFQQGHRLYVEAVKRTKAYNIDDKKNLPWHKIATLREQELMRIVGIKYEILPPRLCCLKLAFIDPETSQPTGGTFSIKHHDMPDVIDFIVLRSNYDSAMKRKWKPGARFRSMIDDAWWMGTIEKQIPFQVEYPDSMFQCFDVHWDNGEYEKMSPWDLEPIDEETVPDIPGNSVPVTDEELKSLMYEPLDFEWPLCGRNVECERIAHGLHQIMELAIAEHFLAPVDANSFPIYYMVIEYPIDLSTIKARIENHFYRRISSIQFDVRYIETNARKFNEPGTLIVRRARTVSDLCLKLISDTECDDIMPMYTQLAADEDLHGEVDVDVEDEDDVDIQDTTIRNRGKIVKRGKSQCSPDSWKEDCNHLLETIFNCDDSAPFRHPVDDLQYVGYSELISCPMDFTTIKEQILCATYENPLEFAKDIRLVIKNSRTYNTNKKSRIYAMTLRLSALIEEHLGDVIKNWKHAMKSPKHKAVNTKYSRSRRSSIKINLRAAEVLPSPRKAAIAARALVSSLASMDNSTTEPSTSRSTRSAAAHEESYHDHGQRPQRTVSKKAIIDSESDEDYVDNDSYVDNEQNRTRRKPQVKTSERNYTATNGGATSTVGRYTTRGSTGSLRPRLKSESDSERFVLPQKTKNTRKRKKSRESDEDSDASYKDKVTAKTAGRYTTRGATGSLRPKKYTTDSDTEEFVALKRKKSRKRRKSTDSEDGADSDDSYSKTSTTKQKVFNKKKVLSDSEESVNSDGSLKENTEPRRSNRTRSTTKRARHDDDNITDDEINGKPLPVTARLRRTCSKRTVTYKQSDEEEYLEKDDPTYTEENNTTFTRLRGRRKKADVHDNEEEDEESESSTESDSNESSDSSNSKASDDGESHPAVRKVRLKPVEKPVVQVVNRPKRHPHPRMNIFDEYHTSSQPSRKTRNQGRQTVQYQEDSDYENGLSDENRGISTSSRGRVRKLTPRARASLVI